jgi:hypothetical protein
MPRTPQRLFLLGLTALVIGQLASPRAAQAFSQSSPATPMGHEFITIASAFELLAEPPMTKATVQAHKGVSWLKASEKYLAGLFTHADEMEKFSVYYRPSLHAQLTDAHRALLKAVKPDDVWPKGLDGSFGARYYNVWSAVMGQRWVDLGGFNVLRNTKCWDTITQMPDMLQPDHFLRRRNDSGPQGAINAIEAAKANFRKYFIEAALADPQDKELITFRDGGAEVSRNLKARKAWFMFGRAAHLFQDSFSTEHGVRDPTTHYQTITDIKSYVCTLNSPGHTHNKPTSGDHGDVVWRHDLAALDYNISFKNLKPYAVGAVLAMEQLWISFLYVRNTPQDKKMMAERMADDLIKKWFGYDPKKVGLNKGITAAEQATCDKNVGTATVTEERVKCLAQLKDDGQLRDPYMHLAYSWMWK